ncbi:MAG: M6 family metalloprotease domain-containing protein [Bacteroidales bacterium]|nr:M6 family metalloprotease domain-containing protein [Bacteroidales bacterium]
MKKYTFLLLLLLIAAVTYAAPARRVSKKVKQSDGTELTVMLSGDESLHYYSTIDGKPLIREANGDFSYATFTPEGQFVSTECLAHDAEHRTLFEKNLVASIDYEGMMVSLNSAHKARSAKFRAAAQKAGSQITPEGDVNIAVVLVQFKDVKFTYTKEDINNVLNTEGYKLENPFAESVGSARDYFIAQSDGKFRPNFMVTDIITLDNDMSYYGGNDANGDDKKASYAVKEGIQKADATFDFSKCDNNGDGEVEFIYCIYAGYSESYGASKNTIWPHQWALSSQAGSITVDGVKCDTYACSGELVYSEEYEPEIGKVLAGIGLICHEFSHCLGLHDIYDTTYESGNWGMDYWDVMDQGNYAAEGYVPVGYSAYQRDFCGWRDLVVLDKKGDYSMKPLTQGGTAYKVVNDANPNEYYILENRKQEVWDTYLFNSGMLVIHVDYNKSAWDNNTINTTKNHPRYTLIPADGKLDVYGEVSAQQFVASLKGDVWPGTSGNTELTNTSVPAAKVYTGGYMNKPIRGIKYTDGIISFNFMGGSFVAPVVSQATDVTETSFVANWEAVEGAEEYNVELYKVTEAADGSGDAATLLSEDFVGCTKTNTDVSATIDDCTATSGWTGKYVYSEGGVLRVGSSKNAGTLTTPIFNATGEVSLSFSAALYNSADTGVKLTVSMKDATGATLASKDVEPAVAMEVYTLAAEVNGEFHVEFTTSASSGKKRVNVDNITLSATLSFSSECVERVSTNELSYKFAELEAGAKYRYRVQAKDAYGASAFSDYMDVQMTPTSIDGIAVEDSTVEVYTLGGVKVYSGAKDAVTVPYSGVYVVKTASKAIKVLF